MLFRLLAYLALSPEQQDPKRIPHRLEGKLVTFVLLPSHTHLPYSMARLKLWPSVYLAVLPWLFLILTSNAPSIVMSDAIPPGSRRHS